MIKIQIIYKVIIIISIVILFFIAFYNGLVVRKYSLKTNKILKDQSIRIVLITDLHSQKYGEKQDKIREKIEAENPDIIALAGDIVDDSGRIEGVKLFIEAIKDIGPIYYVTGNHEIRTGEVDKIKGLFRSLGVNVLENSLQKVNVRGVDLIVAGVDDPNIVGYKSPGSNWYKEVYTSFSNMKDMGGYKILLSHRPEKVDFYGTLPFDLVLSGHAHGGQIRIPFLLNGLYAPHQGFFPKYAGGVYEFENYTLVVSRGVYYNLFLPRIFNPPEIVVIDIEGME